MKKTRIAFIALVIILVLGIFNQAFAFELKAQETRPYSADSGENDITDDTTVGNDVYRFLKRNRTRDNKGIYSF